MKIDRILSILSFLTSKDKVTIQDLANKFEVSKRTIYRDLDTLNMAGFPIVSYPGFGGGVSMVEGYKIDKNALSTTDMKNLYIGLSSLKGLDKNKQVDYLLTRLMPKSENLMQIESDILVDLASWTIPDGSHEMLGDFRKAIVNTQLIELEYHAKSIYSKRIVEPYKLIFKYSFWYLYAFCTTRNDFRLFKFSRISSYTVLEEMFAPKELKDLSTLFNYDNKIYFNETGEPQKIVLQYDLANKDFLLDKFGAQGFSNKDGKGYITFSTARMAWAADLIMSLQDMVRVIQPKSLQDEVKNRINRMCDLYKG